MDETCSAVTARGEPCRNRPVVGSDRCRIHSRPALDEAAIAQLVVMLRAGNYLDVAARAAGVPVEGLSGDAAERIETARAEGEVRGIATIARAATENWQAAAWLLERQYPERWGRPAVRPNEDLPSGAAPAADGLDELASKRSARREAARE